MATIQTSIKLQNNVSSTLKRIDKSLDKLVRGFIKLEKNVSKSMNNISKATNKAAANTSKLTLKNEQVRRSIIQTAKSQEELNKKIWNSKKAEEGHKQAVEKTKQAIISTAKAQDSLNQSKLKTQMMEQKLQQATLRTRAMSNRLNQPSNKSSILTDLSLSRLKGVGGAYLGSQALGAIVNTADELTMTTARINMMNDSLETTEKLQQKIYESAMRSRASYYETADAVAKLRLRAGNIFKSNEEAIVFSETLNKMFAIAGASQSEMYSATLQLTQALGSGVLRGEEFRAVFEAAPNVMQAIADYMNLPIGKLREIANEGAISAEIVKNAMFKATEDVDKKFKKIPKTWGQVWSMTKNYMLKVFEQLLVAIRKITSSERFIGFMNGVGNAISIVAQHLGMLLMLAKDFAAVIYDNWGAIEPVIWGIVAAMVVYSVVQTAMLFKSIGMWAVNTWSLIAYQWALFKGTVAQYGFNAAIAMCPLTWFLYAIIAIVAVFYWAIDVVNKFAGTSISATGLICAAFAFLGAIIADVFIGIYNIGSAVVQGVVNAWHWCCDNIGAVFHNIGVWWDNLWIDARVGFYSFINDVLSKLASLASKIQPLAKLLNIDLSGMIGKHQASITGKIANLESGKRKYKDYTSWQGVDWTTKDYVSPSDWAAKGYEWGSNLGSKVKNLFGFSDPLKNMNALDFNKSMLNGGDGLNDLGKALSDGFGSDNPLLKDIAGYAGDIANNTASSDEDLDLMRALAEREAINRYTMSDLKIEMTNNNNIGSKLDLNDVLKQIQKQVYESVLSTAEGVHY